MHPFFNYMSFEFLTIFREEFVLASLLFIMCLIFCSHSCGGGGAGEAGGGWADGGQRSEDFPQGITLLPLHLSVLLQSTICTKNFVQQLLQLGLAQVIADTPS